MRLSAWRRATGIIGIIGIIFISPRRDGRFLSGRHRRHRPLLVRSNQRLVDLTDQLHPKSTAKMYQHRRIKRHPLHEFAKAQEVLQVRILANLLNRLAIRPPAARLDDQRPQCHPRRQRTLTARTLERRHIRFLRHRPWHHLRQAHPAIGRIQRAAKRQQKL